MKGMILKRSALVVLSLVAISACAGPRTVNGILSTEQRVRFVHGDGIVDCQTPKAGEVQNCRDLNIQYE